MLRGSQLSNQTHGRPGRVPGVKRGTSNPPATLGAANLRHVATSGTTDEAPVQSTAAPTRGTARWARGATVGLTATVLALAGHASGGGGVPPVLPVLLLTGLAVLGSVGLSGRRWSAGPLIGVLLTVQVAFHVAFGDHVHAAFGEPTGSPSTLSPHLRHGVMHAGLAAHSLGWRMVSAHILAALVTALLLRRGEAWCWRLAALAVAAPLRALQLSHGPLAAPSTPPTSRVGRAAPFLRSQLLVLAAPRRGPPAALAG